MLQLVDRVTPSHISLLKYFDNKFAWTEERNAEGVHIVDGWIENFDESFPDFKGKRYAFYWTVQDLINLALVKERPDDIHNTSQPLKFRYDNDKETYVSITREEEIQRKMMEKVLRESNLKSRNLIDIWGVELTTLGKAFIDFIASPVGK